MRTFALVLHVLGWATWVGSQLALAGLLRRAPLYGPGVGSVLAANSKGLRNGTYAGVAMALVGAALLVYGNPAWLRMGFVHAKLAMAAVALYILFVPVAAAQRRLSSGGPPLHGAWFHVAHVIFVAMVALGVWKPF